MYRLFGDTKKTISQIDETATSLEQHSKKQQEKLDEISDTLKESTLPNQESKPSKSFTDIFSGIREKLDESEAAFKRSKDELDKMKMR